MTFADTTINILLGIIQGLTEFIPVSSSGHLEILPVLFGWDKPNTTMILFAHFGTLLSLLVYFHKDIWGYIKAPFIFAITNDRKVQKSALQDLRVIGLVIMATIPAGIVGLLVSDYIEIIYDTNTYGNAGQVATLSAMAFLGAAFLISDDWFRSKRIDLKDLKYSSAFVIGASQVLAFIRGISRSGVTLITAQAFQLSRVEAAKFSFLVSIPLITAASLLGVYDLLQLSEAEVAQALPAAITILVSSFFSGLLAIKYLLNYLEKNGLALFGWYRIIFAILAAFLIFG